MSERYLPYFRLVEDLFEPLVEAVEDRRVAEALLRDLGYAVPDELSAFEELASVTDVLFELVSSGFEAVEADDVAKLVKGLGRVAPDIGRAAASIDDFASSLERNFGGSQFLQDTDILTTIAVKLTDYLVTRYLEEYYPTLYAILMVTGAVEIEDVEDTPTIFHVPYRRRTIHWGDITTILTDPVGRALANLDGGDELLYDRLLYLIGQLGLGLGLLPIFSSAEPATLELLNRGADLEALDLSEELSVLYFPLVGDPTSGVGVELHPIVDATTSRYDGLGMAIRAGTELALPLGRSYEMLIKLSAAAVDGLGVRLDRGGKASFIGSLLSGAAGELADSVQVGIGFSVRRLPEAPLGKMVSLGAPGGVLLEIGSGSLTFGVERMGAFRMYAEGDLVDGMLLLGSGEADGFLSSLLPEEGIRTTFGVGLGVSSDAGLYFKGSSGLEIRVPVHFELGPVLIEHVTFGVQVADGPILLTASTGISALLGPLSAVVEDVGVTAALEPKGDRSGNAGPLDVSWGFKPPNGVGLSIDAEVVKGGGYLYFDYDRGEYAGALELVISEWITVKAIGLITTRMPDGSDGFSLLIIITAEGLGIQLGMGFVLDGLGGLLGLNRSMRLDPLIQGVRTGSVQAVMFPKDVVANAPRIISDLRTFFPPTADRFLIGPMAKVTWGTPALMSLSLCIIIEIPGNIAILGVLRVVMPDEEAPITVVQVNFFGAIEFDKERAYFFAALFDSRIVYITLEGELGVLVSWAKDGDFVVTVGGFHPSFKPPPLPFPTPRRISFDVLNAGYGRISATTYLAVTANTVQMGARIELVLGFSEFGITGFLGFDALFQFNPFFFVVEIAGGVSLKVFGVGAFSISLRFTLEGPTPWRAKGYGKIKILFFSFKASFDRTWGDRRTTTLPPIEVMPLLRDEVAKRENWVARPPPGSKVFVSLRELPATDDVVLHPVGTLAVSQRRIPLELTIDKVGSRKVADAVHFELEAVGGLQKAGDTTEGFAIAQYQNLSDSKKLSLPSFQRERAGIELASGVSAYRTGRVVKRALRYEQIVLDSRFQRYVVQFLQVVGSLFTTFLGGNAAAQSPVSHAQATQMQPFTDGVVVGQESWRVASNRDNTPHDQSPAFASEAQAREAMRAEIDRDPSLASTLHVIPDFEVNRAA